MSELRYAVYLEDPDNPGETVCFVPGDEVPEWAAKQITNPNCWEGGVAPDPSEDKPKRTRATK